MRLTEDPAGLPYNWIGEVGKRSMLIVETEKFSMKNSLLSEIMLYFASSD
jgi:hypothetical protein